jgi:hypothetical protein
MERRMKKTITTLLVSCLCLLLAEQVIAADFLKALNSGLKALKKHAPANTASPVTPNTARQSGKSEVTYEGYSKEFLPIKNLIAESDMKQAYELEQQNIEDNGIDFLNSVEAGLLSIDTGHTLDAIDDFSKAEKHLKLQMNRSVTEDSFFNYGGELLSMASGKGDLTEYRGEPYERILMLNYKSIAFLLNGERKAYNVTRRAIDWQNIEKKEFEKSIDDVKKQVDSNKGKQDNNKTMSYAPGVFDAIFNQYKRHQSKSNSVASAYVNPFGFYMAGIIQEFDSFEDASLRDNARISYKKALELSPKSKAIESAIKATSKSPPRNKRLVHIIAADGFAPEKKTLTFMMNIAGGIVPIKTPLFEPVNSSVKTIKIKAGRTVLATLSPIADIEAITLRHQLDMLPFEHAKVLTSIARNIGENILWNQLGGAGIKAKLFRESFANPDMRSWMTLPKKISAARFYVSKRLKNITIISYNNEGLVLAEKKIPLNSDSHNFIYARTVEKEMHVQINKKLWVATK